MFDRPHHKVIARVLDAMNARFLRETMCYFGGGTAISLMLGEYRESVDIDFLCSDETGYRKLRESVFSNGLSDLIDTKIKILREVHSDRDGVRAVLLVDDTPIKFEIVRESRICLSGMNVEGIPVQCLAKDDLFAEKLLANADRYADKSVMSRDIIDLSMMEMKWGEIPFTAKEKAIKAYGKTIDESLSKAKDMLSGNPAYLAKCLSDMGMSDECGNALRAHIGATRYSHPKP